jgi:hypothetical protein
MSSTESVFPARSSARFKFDYGTVKREDRASFELFTPPSGTDPEDLLQGMFICIRVTPDDSAPFVTWCGIIPTEQLRIFGSKLVGGDYEGAGVHILQAAGLEYLLERRRIQGAWMRISDDDPDNPGEAAQIKSAPPFNVRARTGQHARGNRAAAVINAPGGYGDGLPAFGGNSVWSYTDVLDYLLGFGNPTTTVEPEFVLGGLPSLIDYLDSIPAAPLQHEGRPIKGLLEKLVDRSRGVGARIRWAPNASGGADGQAGLPGGFVELELFPMSDDVILAGLTYLPPNENVETIYLDDPAGMDVVEASVQISDVTTYDRLFVQGAQAISCFSVSLGQTDTGHALAEPAWKAADQTAYDEADEEDKKHPLYDLVYQRFRMPADFNWEVPAEEGDTPQYLALDFDQNGQLLLTTKANAINEHKVFLRKLPIESPGDVAAETPEIPYLDSFIVVKELSGTKAGKWCMLDHPFKPHKPSELVPRDRGFSFDVAPRGPGLPHYNAKGVYTGRTHGVTPKWDYRQMIATVAVKTDTRPTVELLLTGAEHGRHRTMIITLEDVQVWYMATQTIVGLFPSGDLWYYYGPRTLRDDTARLRQVAANAAAYYSKPRKTIAFTRNGIIMGHELGVLLKAQWRDELRAEVASVVTERKYNYDANTTSIKTGHANIDFARFGR